VDTYRQRSARWLCLLGLSLSLLPAAAAAQSIGQPAFQRLWERTDYPVVERQGTHSWIWGPGPFTGELGEWYVEGPGEGRAVQYFDKGRMEINNPSGDPRDPWFVTSGLLTRDMIDGRLQIGNGDYVALPPASIPVAGDPDAGFPTYADLRPYVRAQPRLRLGDTVAERLTPIGKVAAPEFAGLPAGRIVQQSNGYGIPQAFWAFLTQSGTIYRDGRFTTAAPLFDWLYVAGYPIADAFWVRVPVAGVQRDVLVQPFERRLLTYSPANPARFQVEMGNVGRHYFRWRYELPFADGRQALITAPAQDAPISSPLMVQGLERGYAFEARVGVRLRTAGGQLLAHTTTLVHRPDVAMAGPLSTTLSFVEPDRDTPGVVELLDISPRDGSERVIASQPVLIAAPRDGLAGAVALARSDLGARTGQPPATISVVTSEALTWPDTSLGCPAPGLGYLQVLTPGYQVVLDLFGERFDYRLDTSGGLVLCREGRPLGPIGAPLVVPAAGAVTSLPLHVEARVGRPGDELTVISWLEDGPVFSTQVRALPGPDGAGVALASIWPPSEVSSLRTQRAMVEIRAASGELLAARELTFVAPGAPETQPVTLYWLAGEELRAERRSVPRTARIGTAALEELLWGPPPNLGYTSGIPSPEQVLTYPGREPDWGVRVRLLSLVIRDGVATADFSQELRAYGGGSARVWAISQQIRSTLLQFPSVREVRIAIEGQTEGVLEP
jgi:hypothetical protein